MSTKIEWCKNKDGGQGKTWNPITGCTKISPDCQNCYAERMSKRLRGRCGYDAENPFKVTLHPDRLEEPMRWQKPSMIFVCSMGDLFHKDVPDDYIHQVYDAMEAAKQHTFIVCTKRPERIIPVLYETYYLGGGDYLSNVWHLCTAENQEMADKRIPELLRLRQHSPGWRVLGVSVEPMLGPINLRKWLFYQMRCTKCKDTGWVTGLERPCLWCNPGGEFRSSVSPAEKFKPKLDWVICGGETGPDARPTHPDWVRSLRDQCQSAGVPFFFKSWGEWVCRPWSSDNGRKRELCLGMDGTSVYAQVGHMMGFRKPGEALMVRVGKKAAGRLLDGREWNELPGRPVSGCHGER